MTGVGPSWFAADQVFEGQGGWYVGSRDGFSIGPYETREAARTEARELARHVESAADVSEILDVVRRLIEARQANAARDRTYGRMKPVRAGEPPRIGFRSPRLFALFGKWYFLTREGIDVGPYPSKEAAERGEQRLVAQLQRCETDQERRRTILEFMTRSASSSA